MKWFPKEHFFTNLLLVVIALELLFLVFQDKSKRFKPNGFGKVKSPFGNPRKLAKNART